MSYVLLLEQDPDHARHLRTLLQSKGISGEVSAAPDEALARLANGLVRLIVADRDLPDIDAHAFMQRVRDLRPDLPLVLLSEKDDPGGQLARSGPGSVLIMKKPVEAEAFLSAVKRLLAGNATAFSAANGHPERNGDYPGTASGLIPATAEPTRLALERVRSSLLEEGRVAVVYDAAVQPSDLARLAASWCGGSFDAPPLRMGANPGPLQRVDTLRAPAAATALLTVEVSSSAKLGDVLARVGETTDGKRLLIVAPVGVARTSGWLDEKKSQAVTVVPFPSIAERLEDIAAAFFAAWRAVVPEAPFPGDLAKAILGFDWEGAPHEFGRSLRLFRAILGRAQPEKLADPSTRPAFDEVVPAEPREADLPAFLKREQTRFLNKLVAEAGVIEDVASRSGVPVSLLESVEDVAELDLLADEL